MTEVPFDLITRDNASASHLAVLRRAAEAARIENADLERASDDIDGDAGYTLTELIIIVVILFLAIFGLIYLIKTN
jgi:hypothetical protein